MFENIEWLFFDVGSTLVDEHIAYEHRMREIADSANTTYSSVNEMAMTFYKQNKKGDLETAKLLGMHTIWIKQGFGQYWNITQEVEKADYVVHSLTEICNIL